MQLHLCFLVIALLTIVQAHPWYYPYEKPAGFNAAAVKKGPARVITCSQANYRYAGPKLGCVQACQAGFIYVKGSLASKPVCNKASTTTATTTATTTKTKSSTTTTTTTSTKTKTKSKTTTTIKKTTDTKTVHHYSTTTLKTKTSTATTTTTTVVATATCPIAAPSQCVDPDTGNSNCFNFQTSNTNCGSCNNNCAAVLGARASTCQAGQCVASACYSGFSLQHGKCEITGTLAAYQTSNNALLGYATSYYYNNIPLLLVLPDPTMASVFTYDPTNKTMSADSQYFTVLQEVAPYTTDNGLGLALFTPTDPPQPGAEYSFWGAPTTYGVFNTPSVFDDNGKPVNMSFVVTSNPFPALLTSNNVTNFNNENPSPDAVVVGLVIM